jgi:hypothetical protein
MLYPENVNPSFAPRAAGWRLLVGLPDMNTGLLVAIARLPAPASAAAEHTWVRVLDGGNRFNAYTVARAARGRPDILERISVSRAFTCYQVLSLLESTAAAHAPFVVLDMLHTFYDESVPVGERKRLLRACLTGLQRLAKAASGLVSVHPPALPGPGTAELLNLLEQAAADIFFYPSTHASVALPEQMKLF